jgi:hypothetical protein
MTITKALLLGLFLYQLEGVVKVSSPLVLLIGLKLSWKAAVVLTVLLKIDMSM